MWVQICPRFGLDEELWEPVGEELEELDRNKRRVKYQVTTTLRGLQLNVWLQETQYGGRPPERVLMESEEQVCLPSSPCRLTGDPKQGWCLVGSSRRECANDDVSGAAFAEAGGIPAYGSKSHFAPPAHAA
jgi:hypothetical protein